jgi:hypothetical protein
VADIPPSLGDEKKQSLKLIHEEFPLASPRKALVQQFEAILNQGGVQKVVVEVGKPLKVSRYTASDDVGPLEMKSNDLFANARNAEMQELDSAGLDSFHEYIFRAFGIITQKRLVARAFLVSNLNLLRANLDVDKFWDLSQLCGVDVMPADEVPQDVLLLTASEAGEDEIKLSLRMLMDERKLK